TLTSPSQSGVGTGQKGSKGSAGATGSSAAPTFSTVYTNPMSPAQPSAGGPPVAPMPQPFNQQAWDDALGRNVMWMAKNNVQSASLQLNPAHLGPLELKISLNHDQANVSFVVHHAAVRDAIEAALPRLKEMFGDGGVNLANVNVSDHSASGQHASGSDQGQGQGTGRQGAGGEGIAGVGDAQIGAVSRRPLGLVDYFA
ncbi:MAG TPA: flagellar hook-length control protein FliK, partial [Pseudodesulfovibrio sp.]|nr:flagellar hook-length control protein FliK [Pseudodesulfovibrio sp.]